LLHRLVNDCDDLKLTHVLVDLGLAQILPMFDDDTGAEPKIISASFADPYLLLVRDDASIYVVRCDESNELEDIEREDNTLLEIKWLSGCLYTDSGEVFSEKSSSEGRDGDQAFMFLLSAEGALYVSEVIFPIIVNYFNLSKVYALPDLSKPVYVAEGLSFIPPTLSADYVARRAATREMLTEILVTDLGDSTSKSPYLIVS
jgi:cleavage and polyadenylation specificity factor subunit 1